MKNAKSEIGNEERYRKKVLEQIDLTRELEDGELRELIHQVLLHGEESGRLSLEEKIRLSRDLFNTFRKLDLLQELLEDEEITEIMINGTKGIFLEKNGRVYRSDKYFVSEGKLEDVIQQMVSGANRYVNEAVPIADTRLADGSRVNVVLSPVALDGPAVTIRKFPKERITMEKLLELGSIDEETKLFLSKLVKSKYNIFISGGTGAGKTTFLNALSQFIPSDERIITIEDNAELQIQGIDNLVRLEARRANLEGEGEITIRDLIRTALRMRPDRLIVGEVRGGETIDLLQAYNTGHAGGLSTGHANSPGDMLNRLETMALMGMDLPLVAIQRQIASALDIIIHLGRLPDKSRKVLEIAEVSEYRDGRIQLRSLYRFREEGRDHERIHGRLVKENELLHRDKLLEAGY
jgi:pilus assembly protein CpaF